MRCPRLEHARMPCQATGNGLLANHVREALTQQFHTVHFCLCTAPAVIAAPSIARRAHPKDSAERGRQSAWPRYFDARSASLRAAAPTVMAFHGLAFLRGGMIATAPRLPLSWFASKPLPVSGWHHCICGCRRHRPLPGNGLLANRERGSRDAADPATFDARCSPQGSSGPSR